MYIYGTYIPPFGGASLSLILFPSHQARNIITKPPIALPHNLSHISPIFSICAIPPSTAPTTPSTILQSLLLPSSNIALHCMDLGIRILGSKEVLVDQGGRTACVEA